MIRHGLVPSIMRFSCVPRSASAWAATAGEHTFSKSIDDSSVACGCTTWLGGFTSVQDPNRLYLERSVSEFDIPQVSQFSYVYQLPVGRGKTFGSDWNWFLDAVLGGWQTNGIWRFDDGLPIQLTLNGGQSLPTYGSSGPTWLVR